MSRRNTFSRFDIAEHLDTDEDVAAYQAEAAATGDPALLARAEATIIRAQERRRMAAGTRPFDPANYLKTAVDIASYRETAAEDGDPEIVASAEGDVARAIRLSQEAK